MTIQEYKGHLDHYMSVLEDAGATADELYGARCMASYTYNLVNNHMIEGKFNVDISKLEDGKCYVIGIDPNEIKPDIANKVFCALKDAVADRGIELLAIPKQMKIDDIYSHALANKVSMHALYVNELIPPMEPWVFRLPNPIAKIKTKPLPTKTVYKER